MGRKKLFIVEEENAKKLQDLLEKFKVAFPKEFGDAFSGIEEGKNYVERCNTSLTSFGEENGPQRNMTGADIKLFNDGFKKIATGLGKMERFFKANRSQSKEKNAENLKLVQELQTMVAEDMYTVSQLKAGKTMEQSLDDIEPKLLEVDQSQLSKTGGNLSSRIPVTVVDSNGNKVKGFFTKEATYDPAATYDSIVENLEKNYPGAANPIKNLLRNSRKPYIDNAKQHKKAYVANDAAVINFIMNECIDGQKGAVTVDKLYSLMVKANGEKNMPKIDNLKAEIQNAEKENRKVNTQNLSEFEKAIFEFNKGMVDMVRTRGIYGLTIGAKPGDNLDKKNVSTSIVANLLGVPKVIAEAKPMAMVIDGQPVSGTFMANAEGMDIHHVKVEDIKKIDPMTAYDDTNGYKDLFDLQVVDYICGNVDRHIANMTYQYDNNGKFVGVQGFDNDASFGSNVPGANERKDNLPALNQFNYISESMYNTIMEMTPEMLTTALKAQNLPEHSVDAACDRLLNLKSHLEKSATVNEKTKEFNPIKVVKDGEFKNKDFTTEFLKRLKAEGLGSTGYMGYALMAPNKAKEWKDNENYKEYVQPEVKAVKDYITEEHIEKNASDFQKALVDLKSVDKAYIRSSKEFRNIRASLEGLATFAEKIKNPPMSLKDARLFAEKINQLENYNDAYINKKSKELDKSEYADSRLRFVRHLKSFVKAKKMEFADRVVNEIAKKPNKEITSFTKQNQEPQKGVQVNNDFMI